MWTKREKEIYTLAEIEEYVEEMDCFHDYMLGNVRYDSEKGFAEICIETDHEPKKSAEEGYVWNFEFEGIEEILFAIDVPLRGWVDEILILDDKKVMFSLTSGCITISASKVKLGIPSMQ